MEQIQFISTTPEQVSVLVAKEVNKAIERLTNQFQPKEPKRYLTRLEVAEMLQVDISTVWAWTKKGKLKAYGIGNRVYYLRNELEQSIIPINS